MFRSTFLAAALAFWLAGPAAAQGRPYLPDRLGRERIALLVGEPAALLETGDAAGAAAAFERMLAAAIAAHGPGSLEVADLLSAFGAKLAEQAALDGNPGLRWTALPYLARAIPLYRALFGPDHPEVAVALNSWADVERELRPHWPGPAEAALAEAYRIRLAALGPAHEETIWTILYLSDVRGRIALTGGAPARMEAVAAELMRAIALSRASDLETGRQIPVVTNVRLARLYARHGQVSRALRAMAAAGAAARAHPDIVTCLDASAGAMEIAALLGERLTAAKRAPLDRLAGADCFGELADTALQVDALIAEEEIP